MLLSAGLKLAETKLVNNSLIRTITNQPCPRYLVEQHCQRWTRMQLTRYQEIQERPFVFQLVSLAQITLHIQKFVYGGVYGMGPAVVDYTAFMTPTTQYALFIVRCRNHSPGNNSRNNIASARVKKDNTTKIGLPWCTFCLQPAS